VVCLAPRAPGDSVRSRRPSGACVRPLNFPVRSRMQLRSRLTVALGWAAGVTLLSAALSAMLITNHPDLAYAIFGPDAVLQSLAPCPVLNVGPIVGCEGTPLNLVMYIASFFISILVYGTVAYVLIGRRRAATSNNHWRGP
jgi:hypothetical protein